MAHLYRVNHLTMWELLLRSKQVYYSRCFQYQSWLSRGELIRIEEYHHKRLILFREIVNNQLFMWYDTSFKMYLIQPVIHCWRLSHKYLSHLSMIRKGNKHHLDAESLLVMRDPWIDNSQDGFVDTILLVIHYWYDRSRRERTISTDITAIGWKITSVIRSFIQSWIHYTVPIKRTSITDQNICFKRIVPLLIFQSTVGRIEEK